MMCSAYLLNKQGDNRQPCHTSLSTFNPSVVPYRVLTVASWPAYRFLRRQVRWSGIPISKSLLQFVMIHTVKGFGVVNETEVDVFLEFPCFLYDPVNVGNLISGSSAFSNWACTSESSLFMYYWSLTWRILSITLLAWKMRAMVVWTVFGIAPSLALKWKVTFSSPVAMTEFSKFVGILTAAF